MDNVFTLHHCTLSVRDIERSEKFYRAFEFNLALLWTAEDGALRIAHLTRDDGFILELFEYSTNHDAPELNQSIGNDLERVGVKHMAFAVSNVRDAAAVMSSASIGKMTEITHGRTGIDYFFIADPDGNWVEVVQDDRRFPARADGVMPYHS